MNEAKAHLGPSGQPRVYFNEYNVLLSNTVYLPLASGLLKAYVQSIPSLAAAYDFMPILYKRDLPENILAQVANPSVAAFSVSSWSEQLSLTVARTIKERYPECLVVFGGPQVPFVAEEYFAQHSFVDVAVRGEGERSFAQVLDRYLESRDFQGIPGVSYRHAGMGACIRNDEEQPALPENSLDLFPSPYLSGVFDDFMKMDLRWQAIIETNRGCPFPCTYCFWGQGGLNKKYRYFSLERVEREIEWCGKHDIAYLFCADSNFGMLDRDQDIVKMLARTKKKYSFPERFRVNYGKNTDDKIFSIARYLHEHELEKAITISFQTFSGEALKNIRRKNIKLESFQSLQRKYIQYNIPTYSELILGLPGETYESWIDGLDRCLSAGIKNNIFVYLCQVLQNTEMARPAYLKEHGIRTVRSPLNEGHGAVRSKGEVVEYEHVIVGTNSMPVEEWKRAAVFSWVMQAFVGLKLAFFVMIHLKERHGIRYREFLEYVCQAAFPEQTKGVIKSNLERLVCVAEAITTGGSKTIEMSAFGNIYWEPEEYFYFNLSDDKHAFYDELHAVTAAFLRSRGTGFDEQELADVFLYQRTRMPQHLANPAVEASFRYNVPEFFDAYFSGKTVPMMSKPQRMILTDVRDYERDRRIFAREVVIYGRKGNNLLYHVRWQNGEAGEWREASF